MSDEHEDGFENSSLLNDKEARILGALMEKQLTTPDVYPLTLNSLVLACNQKTSREPVTAYESGEVQRQSQPATGSPVNCHRLQCACPALRSAFVAGVITRSARAGHYECTAAAWRSNAR